MALTRPRRVRSRAVTLLVAVAASAGLAAGPGAPGRGGIRQATGPASAAPERTARPAWQPGLGPEQIRIPATVAVTRRC